jgi:hypothetical protein
MEPLLHRHWFYGYEPRSLLPLQNVTKTVDACTVRELKATLSDIEHDLDNIDSGLA